jgi:C4-type Zn-finger protein
MKWKVDPDTPQKPIFLNCIRCLRQYKLTIPYLEAVPINRDFCDECINDLPYEEREKFALEMIPPQNISTGNDSPQETGAFPLEP